MICDAAQIECRILNHVAGQDDVLKAFRQGRDVYCEIATEIFGRKITPADKRERFIGKRTELSCGYGIGPAKLNFLLGTGPDLDAFHEAERAVAVYRSRHPQVKALWAQGNHVLEVLQNGHDGLVLWAKETVAVKKSQLLLPNGMRLDFDLHFDEVARQYWRTDARGCGKIWGGALTGEVIQALAAVYFREVIFNIAERTGAKPVCLIHDSAIYVVRECDEELMLKQVVEEFRRAPHWLKGCPLDCEVYASKTLQIKEEE